MQMYEEADDLKGQRSTQIIIWTNLVDLESRMPYAKIQPLKVFLVLYKKIFSVLPYMFMADILFNDAQPFAVIWLVPGKVMLHNDFQITGWTKLDVFGWYRVLSFLQIPL